MEKSSREEPGHKAIVLQYNTCMHAHTIAYVHVYV